MIWGRIWNATKNWSLVIKSNPHLIEVMKERCDIDDELYVRDYRKKTKTWTTPKKMGYEEIINAFKSRS